MTDQQFIADLRKRYTAPRHRTAPTERTVLAVDLCDQAGISYRQCDFWSTTGRLHPLGEVNPGSGYQRRYPESEVEIATTMRRLIDGGFQLQAAHDTARRLVAGTVARVGDGLVLLVRPGEP